MQWIMARALLAAPLYLSAAAAEPTDKTTTAAQTEKKICRKDRATGSLVRVRRICMTKSDWDKLHSDTKNDIEDIQRRGNMGLPGPDTTPLG